MNLFTISQLEKFSDIKTHTIRMWENRYGLLKPERSAGKTRYYSIDDVERLLCVALLKRHGDKVSNLSKCDTKALIVRVNRLSSECEIFQNKVNELLTSFYKIDIERFENVLDEITIQYGYANTLRNLIIPFLYKADILSYKSSTPEVHFAVTAVRRKILSAIEQVTSNKDDSRKAVLFLPQGEHYDLILLYIYYRLKSHGVKIYYLGTNITEESLKQVILLKLPSELFVYTISPKKYRFDALVSFLEENFPKTTLTVVSPEDLSAINTHRVKFTHFLSL